MNSGHDRVARTDDIDALESSDRIAAGEASCGTCICEVDVERIIALAAIKDAIKRAAFGQREDIVVRRQDDIAVNRPGIDDVDSAGRGGRINRIHRAGDGAEVHDWAAHTDVFDADARSGIAVRRACDVAAIDNITRERRGAFGSDAAVQAQAVADGRRRVAGSASLDASVVEEGAINAVIEFVADLMGEAGPIVAFTGIDHAAAGVEHPKVLCRAVAVDGAVALIARAKD